MTRLKLEPLTLEDAIILNRLMQKFKGTPYLMRLSVAGYKDADAMYYMEADRAPGQGRGYANEAERIFFRNYRALNHAVQGFNPL